MEYHLNQIKYKMNDISIFKKIKIREKYLIEIKEQYSQSWDSWKIIESKAQPIASVAGIFIAGLIAFLTKDNLSLSLCGKILLTLISISLIFCLFFAFCAIGSKLIETPHVIEYESNDESKDIIDASENDDVLMQRYYNLINTSIDDRRTSLNNLNQTILSKRNYLNLAIFSLLSSAFFSTIFILINIY